MHETWDSERIQSHLRRPSAFQPPKHVWTSKLISALIKIDADWSVKLRPDEQQMKQMFAFVSVSAADFATAWIKVTKETKAIESRAAFSDDPHMERLPCWAPSTFCPLQYKGVQSQWFSSKDLMLRLGGERSWWMVITRQIVTSSCGLCSCTWHLRPHVMLHGLKFQDRPGHPTRKWLKLLWPSSAQSTRGIPKSCVRKKDWQIQLINSNTKRSSVVSYFPDIWRQPS